MPYDQGCLKNDNSFPAAKVTSLSVLFEQKSNPLSLTDCKTDDTSHCRTMKKVFSLINNQ